jgi:hypothetical protein
VEKDKQSLQQFIHTEPAIGYRWIHEKIVSSKEKIVVKIQSDCFLIINFILGFIGWFLLSLANLFPENFA